MKSLPKVHRKCEVFKKTVYMGFRHHCCVGKMPCASSFRGLVMLLPLEGTSCFKSCLASWRLAVEQPTHKTPICAWLETGVILQQPGHIPWVETGLCASGFLSCLCFSPREGWRSARRMNPQMCPELRKSISDIFCNKIKWSFSFVSPWTLWKALMCFSFSAGFLTCKMLTLISRY